MNILSVRDDPNPVVKNPDINKHENECSGYSISMKRKPFLVKADYVKFLYTADLNGFKCRLYPSGPSIMMYPMRSPTLRSMSSSRS